MLHWIEQSNLAQHAILDKRGWKSAATGCSSPACACVAGPPGHELAARRGLPSEVSGKGLMRYLSCVKNAVDWSCCVAASRQGAQGCLAAHDGSRTSVPRASKPDITMKDAVVLSTRQLLGRCRPVLMLPPKQACLCQRRCGASFMPAQSHCQTFYSMCNNCLCMEPVQLRVAEHRRRKPTKTDCSQQATQVMRSVRCIHQPLSI